MRASQRIAAARIEAFGERAHAAGGVFGDSVGRAAGFEVLWRLEQPAQLLEIFRLANVFQQDGVDFARGAGEMGVYLDAPAVGYDKQWRVVERERVGHQLFQRRAQIAAGRFVFPGEATALPHVGPASAFAAFLEQAALILVFAFDARRFHTKQIAQVFKVGLCTRAF